MNISSNVQNFAAPQPAAAPRQAPAQGPVDVVILPAKARNLDEARQELARAKELMSSFGAATTRELPSIGALKATLDQKQREKLAEAGFATVEDKKIPVVPPRPTGWLLTPEGLKAAEQAAQAAKSGESVPEAEFQALGSGALSALPSFEGDSGAAVLRPFFGTDRRRGAEGPSDYIGELPTTGKGVTIAILDSGLYPHPDFGDRILKYVSATGGNPYHPDAMGHGTHVAADAAGSGEISGGRFRGPAPGANIVGVQVLDGEGEGDYSSIVEQLTAGLNWCVENADRYNIRVVNMSLGMPLVAARESWFGPTTLYDPIGAAINAAVEAGITVVVAAGNDGNEEGTIAQTPATNDNVITVGAIDTRGTPQDRRDDVVAEFSSRGPTPDGRIKPDILAPGVNIMAANAPGSFIEEQNAQVSVMREAIEQMSGRELQVMAYKLVRYGMAPGYILRMHPEEMRQMLLEGLEEKPTAGRLKGGAAYMSMDGTSMASPIVAGVVAAMLEANPRLTPEQVKVILMKTADRMPGARNIDQGAGAINAQKAVAIAAELARRNA